MPQRRSAQAGAPCPRPAPQQVEVAEVGTVRRLSEAHTAKLQRRGRRAAAAGACPARHARGCQGRTHASAHLQCWRVPVNVCKRVRRHVWELGAAPPAAALPLLEVLSIFFGQRGGRLQRQLQAVAAGGKGAQMGGETGACVREGRRLHRRRRRSTRAECGSLQRCVTRRRPPAARAARRARAAPPALPPARCRSGAPLGAAAPHQGPSRC